MTDVRKEKHIFFIVIHLLDSIIGKNTHTIAYRHIHFTPRWSSLIYLKWIIWQFISLNHNFTSPAFLVLLFAPLHYFSLFRFKIFIIRFKEFYFISFKVVDYHNIFTLTLILFFGEIWPLFSLFSAYHCSPNYLCDAMRRVDPLLSFPEFISVFVFLTITS